MYVYTTRLIVVPRVVPLVPDSKIKRDIDAFNLEKNANPTQKKRKKRIIKIFQF